MAEDFALQVTEGPAELLVTLSGTVTETSRFDLPDPRGRRVIIDARGIERMNSLGVRNWVDFIEQLETRSPDVVIRRLPPVMVWQAGMISTFVGRSRIESFLSPWICPRCETTLEQLHGYFDEVPLSISCPSCRSAMELDWDRDAYLSFRTA